MRSSQDPHQQHGPEQTAHVVAAQRGLALGVDDPAVVVEDANDFELHGVPPARIIGGPSPCQGTPCRFRFMTC